MFGLRVAVMSNICGYSVWNLLYLIFLVGQEFKLFLRLLPRLITTSISPFIFPSITCFRRQFLRKMCPIQLAFRFLTSISRRRFIRKKIIYLFTVTLTVTQVM